MRSLKSLLFVVAAAAILGGCGSAETPDEQAPEKPKSAPNAPPMPGGGGGPTKAPSGG